jgi:hypothetical protein
MPELELLVIGFFCNKKDPKLEKKRTNLYHISIIVIERIG